MSSPEETKTATGKLNLLRRHGSDVSNLRKAYGFTLNIQYSGEGHNKSLTTAFATLKGGCLAIKSCPVFKTLEICYGNSEARADLYPQIIKWFKDNSSKLLMTYVEEVRYLDLRAKILMSQASGNTIGDDFDAYINNNIKNNGHLQRNQEQAAAETSSMNSNVSTILGNMAQLQLETAVGNNGRGTKRAREDDADMADDGMCVRKKPTKRAKERAKKSLIKRADKLSSDEDTIIQSPKSP